MICMTDWSHISATDILPTVAFMVRLPLSAKTGNCPIAQQENGRTNYGASIFIHNYLKIIMKKCSAYWPGGMFMTCS